MRILKIKQKKQYSQSLKIYFFYN